MNTRLPKDAGEVGILNVGAGDTKLSFDPKNPAERIRAARVVADMLRRGYALLVEVERHGQKVYERALSFDETKCEYIIADLDPIAAQAADQQERQHGEQQVDPPARPAPAGKAPGAPSKRGRGGRKAVPAEGAKAVAVARSAGG